jgi:hypothetical protein
MTNMVMEAQKKEFKSRSTVALSLLVHGEAVRFNRGKGGSGRYDFKHLIDQNGNAIPYVSSQCFKKHWRETLPYSPSPITRGVDAKGKEKNQVYTSGDPMKYVDDDLFGYMIAGAAEDDSTDNLDDTSIDVEIISPEEEDDQLSKISFSTEQLKTDKTWINLLKDDSKSLHKRIVESLSEDARKEFDSTAVGLDLSESLRVAITETLNRLITNDHSSEFFTESNFPELGKKTGKKQLDELATTSQLTVRNARKKLLEKSFAKGFEAKKKRNTTKRTAPVRMHALVAFSGIRKAEDFQTFSRDVTLSGKNSVLNPNHVGIYSGWMKTRILIEAFRVGKFFVGANMDILEDQIGEYTRLQEINPYDRNGSKVEFIQLSDDERKDRISVAVKALGDIGNSHGPASGALHDGSLKPKAFIGALMNCADSPFDTVWEDSDGKPRMSLSRLKAILRDWEDLFQEKTIYIGMSQELLGDDDIEDFSKTLNEAIASLGFTALVDTPRQALNKFAKGISN